MSHKPALAFQSPASVSQVQVVIFLCYVRRKVLQTYCYIDGGGQTSSLDPWMDLSKLSPLALCELGLGPLQQLQFLPVLF